MEIKKSDTKELEEKLKKLTVQLEQEREDRKRLEQKLREGQLTFSFQFVSQQINALIHKLNLLLNWKSPKQEKQKGVSTVSVTRSVLEESVSDDLGTYKAKLKNYTQEQLEDIFININRAAFPERFSAVIEELKARL